MIVSIDPGVRGCGMAAFSLDKQLVRASYVHGTSDKKAPIEMITGCAAHAALIWMREVTKIAGINSVVIERPQTYGGRSASGDTNDLLDLTLLVGFLLGHISYARLIRPAQWKGQVPKKTKHGTNPIELRARGKLTQEELARVELPQKKLQHNVFDAIGIGMWYLGR